VVPAAAGELKIDGQEGGEDVGVVGRPTLRKAAQRFRLMGGSAGVDRGGRPVRWPRAEAKPNHPDHRRWRAPSCSSWGALQPLRASALVLPPRGPRRRAHSAPQRKRGGGKSRSRGCPRPAQSSCPDRDRGKHGCSGADAAEPDAGQCQGSRLVSKLRRSMLPYHRSFFTGKCGAICPIRHSTGLDAGMWVLVANRIAGTESPGAWTIRE
jgi:hypothetical protein